MRLFRNQFLRVLRGTEMRYFDVSHGLTINPHKEHPHLSQPFNSKWKRRFPQDIYAHSRREPSRMSLFFTLVFPHPGKFITGLLASLSCLLEKKKKKKQEAQVRAGVLRLHRDAKARAV